MRMEMTDESDNKTMNNNEKDDLEKRRPKPFRYIKNLSEISEDHEILSTTIMSTQSDDLVKKLINQFDSVVGVGDVNAIERVLKKHESKYKRNDPSIR